MLRRCWQERSAGHRSEKNACCGLPPPSGGRGRVRKLASTRVHVDEVVWCILETVLWSLDDAAFGRMRSRSSTVLWCTGTF